MSDDKQESADKIVGSNDGSERLVVGNYTITRLDNGNYWVGHQSGEGMETRGELFEDFIHTFYVQEF